MEGKSRGMGSHKHGVSGHSGKSPKMRLWERMEAEKNERKRKPTETFSSIKELFSGRKTTRKPN